MRSVKRKDTKTAGQLEDSKKSPAEREEPKNRTAQGTQGPRPDKTTGTQADGRAGKQTGRQAGRQAGNQIAGKQAGKQAGGQAGRQTFNIQFQYSTSQLVKHLQ